MKVLITGVAGFIASHLAATLCAGGHDVLGIDNLNDQYTVVLKEHNLNRLSRLENFRFLRADFCEPEVVATAFSTFQPQRIVHLGAMGNVRRSVADPLPYVMANVYGTTVLLDAAARLGIEQFILASTSSVYGNTSKIPFVESDPTDSPLAPYPASKKSCELIAHAFHNLYRFPVTILRFFNVYGPGGRPDMMPFIIAEALCKGTPVKLFDNGAMSRDWTFIDDIIAGLLLALEKPQDYEIYNLGRGEPIELRQFTEILEKLAGKPLNAINVAAPPSEPKITYADIAKAQAQLSYAPRVSIREGLERFWNWYINEYQTISAKVDKRL
jgi:UDP-glucuronate 4-epimerase